MCAGGSRRTISGPSAGNAGQRVVGQNLVGLPSTDYAAHTIMNHATDYGNIRYEMGYASAICFVLFAAMLLANKGINWLLGKYLD